MININGKEYPTYATVEQADEYFQASYGSEWENLDDEDKEKLLVTATRSIDKSEYRGKKADEEQPLQFPRIINGKLTDDDLLMRACCEEAMAIYSNGQTKDYRGIKRIDVQDTSIEFNSNVEDSQYASDVVDDLLLPYRYLGVSVLY